MWNEVFLEIKNYDFFGGENEISEDNVKQLSSDEKDELAKYTLMMFALLQTYQLMLRVIKNNIKKCGVGGEQDNLAPVFDVFLEQSNFKFDILKDIINQFKIEYKLFTSHIDFALMQFSPIVLENKEPFDIDYINKIQPILSDLNKPFEENHLPLIIQNMHQEVLRQEQKQIIKDIDHYLKEAHKINKKFFLPTGFRLINKIIKDSKLADGQKLSKIQGIINERLKDNSPNRTTVTQEVYLQLEQQLKLFANDKEPIKLDIDDLKKAKTQTHQIKEVLGKIPKNWIHITINMNKRINHIRQVISNKKIIFSEKKKIILNLLPKIEKSILDDNNQLKSETVLSQDMSKQEGIGVLTNTEMQKFAKDLTNTINDILISDNYIKNFHKSLDEKVQAALKGEMLKNSLRKAGF